MSNPLDDTSRWTMLNARREMPEFIRDGMRDMMHDFLRSLPADAPARLVWAALPQAPGWEIDLT